MKFLFVCRAFDHMAGGVERMATSLMNELVCRGHEISLLTWDVGTPAPFYPLSPAIRWHRLNLGDPAKTAGTITRVRRLIQIRSFIRAVVPHAIIGFQSGAFLSAKLASIGSGIPVVAAERNSPSRLAFTSEGRHPICLYMALRLASAITVQFAQYCDMYPGYLRSKIIYIPNPVFKSSRVKSIDSERPDVLLSVGRLSYQKNYATLISAFALLASEFSHWQLHIAGEGEERLTLEKQIRENHLQGRVQLLGALADIESIYSAASIFCLPSRWEGFPNALSEALSRGLPAVGFSGCDGVRHLIAHGENGLLAEGNGDPIALADTLRRLMSDKALRVKMGEAATGITNKFPPTVVYDAWERLLLQVSSHAKKPVFPFPPILNN